MAVRKTEILPPETPSETFNFPDLAAPPELAPEDMALENILADLGGDGADASVHVYRVSPGKPNAFVGQFGPLEFSMEHLQANFGPGDYKIHVRQNGRLRANRMISIAAPRNPVQIAPQNQTRDNDVLNVMREGFQNMATMMQRTIETMAMMQPKQKTTRDMLEEMALMKSVFNNDAPRQDPMQVIELAATLADKITPRSGEVGNGEILLEAIKNFGPMLAAGAASSMQPAAPMPFHAPQILQNPVAPIAPQTANPTPENDPMFMMKMYLNVFISHAENDHHPDTYAEVVLDTVGEEKALEFLNAPGWFDKLAELNPRVREPKIQQWLYELRRVIIDLTSPDETGIDGAIHDQDSAVPDATIPSKTA